MATASKQATLQPPSSSRVSQSGAKSAAAPHPNPFTNLQRAVGNQGMLRLLHPSDSSRSASPPTAPSILQTKLTINQPGDIYEQEADRVADQIIRADPVSAPSHPATEGPGTSLQRNSIPAITQHTGDTGSEAADAPGNVHQVLHSPGQPLDTATRNFMEPRFGRDFSNVRIHSDPVASASAHEIHARAYTAGSDVVFGTNQFAPGTEVGRRLIAHELSHVVQQTHGGIVRRAEGAASVAPVNAIASSAPRSVIQRDDDDDDPQTRWNKLGETDRKEVENLEHDYLSLSRSLGFAQSQRGSSLRQEWGERLQVIGSKIYEVDSEEKLLAVEAEFADLNTTIDATTAKARAEWEHLSKRYSDEDQHLRAAKSIDAEESAKYLEQLHKGASRGLGAYITEDDYNTLKFSMDNQTYIWTGSLSGARIRVNDLTTMLRTVAELRRDGEDADKLIPRWNIRVNEEVIHLNQLAASAEASSDSAPTKDRKEGLLFNMRQLHELRDDLLQRQQDTLNAHQVEESAIEKGFDFVKGGVEAVGGIFVETANEAVDLVKIGAHFASFGKYEPKLTSDMAAAAAQGATTTDLLKGMVTGLIETPSRFLKACEDGDWEAIGKETVNLYMLAKTIREVPESIKRIPDAARKLPLLIEKTRRSLRVLKARNIALELQVEGRLLPEPPKTQLKAGAPVGEKAPQPPSLPSVANDSPPAPTAPKQQGVRSGPPPDPRPPVPSPKDRPVAPPDPATVKPVDASSAPARPSGPMKAPPGGGPRGTTSSTKKTTTTAKESHPQVEHRRPGSDPLPDPAHSAKPDDPIPVARRVRGNTKPFLNDQLAKLSSPSHPLHDALVVESGTLPDGTKTYKWRTTEFTAKSGRAMKGRYEGSDSGVVVQVGHRVSFASGAQEAFMLEDADLNQVSGQTIESKGGESTKIAVEVDGVVVDLASLQKWESIGEVPAGTVAKAKRLP